MTLSSLAPDHSESAPIRAAFLDRDGVINVDYGYVYKWSDFHFLSGAVEGMKMLQDSGFVLIIVTNQSGIARGYYNESDFHALNVSLLHYLDGCGVNLAGIYYCPHHPSIAYPFEGYNCMCRKPAPGLILKAQIEHNICLAQSIMIGDKFTDLQAAESAGVGLKLLVDNSYPSHELDTIISWRGNSLLACAKFAIAAQARVL